MSVEDRAAVLEAVGHLMALGASGLREAVEGSGPTRQGWCERGDSVPAPLANIADGLPESANAGSKNPRKRRGRGPRPRHEVRQMMARLERAAGLVSK